jgi:transposase
LIDAIAASSLHIRLDSTLRVPDGKGKGALIKYPRPLEAAPTPVGGAREDLAPSNRGRKRGLKDRSRTVLLMLDETLVTETPPLSCCSGPIGEQVQVPISGNRAKRVLHGAINIRSGDLALLITEDWTPQSHEAFLRLIRAHWRGWNLVLFEDRASQHKSARAWAEQCLKIETRLLPKATPELNAMDHLWRHTKRETLGSRATLSIEASALAACQYLIDLSPQDRLRKAGVLSGNFWLTR